MLRETPPEPPKLSCVGCVSTLLSNIKEIEEFENQKEAGQPLRYYYRGLSNDRHDLTPSVMRKENHRAREKEGEMLRDLVARQPDEFSRFPSALDRWMLAQHHGLYTRFLDISANPLVGLFFACGGSKDDCSKDDDSKANGLLYALATTRDRVKPYDSDSVSIVASFAQLRRCEQKEILKKTEDFLREHGAFDRQRGDFTNRRLKIMHGLDPKDIVQKVKEYHDFLGQDNQASGHYSYMMGRLWTLIKREKPYFVGNLMNPRDLFRIFIVQPRLLFPRIRAQSGAFLVSAHHERFDFETKEQNGQLLTKRAGVPYNYYPMRVKAGRKKCILRELRSLNISKETLFPGLESSAKAIIDA